MALTATASQGFEFHRYIANDEVMWVPGDPGDTYVRGDLVTFTVGEGVADRLATDETPYGVVLESVVCSSATTAGYPDLGEGASKGWGQVQDDQTKSLIPIRPLVPAGSPVLKATFASHADDTIVSYTASTPAFVHTNALGGNDDCNGALIYVYDGPGAGQWNIAQDYVTGTATVTLHRIFNTAITSASSVIILEGEGGGAALGVGFFGRCVPGDHNNLIVNNGADDGDLTVCIDAREVREMLSNLMLPVVPSTLFGLFA